MAQEIGAFSPEDARFVLETARQIQRSGVLAPGHFERLIRRIPRHIGGDGSSDAAIFLTPSGGIPAMTGSGPWAWGMAECTRVDTDGNITATLSEVHNSVSAAIPGSRIIQAKKIYGKWFADVADCAVEDDDAGIVPPGPDPEPPIDIGV